MGSRKYEAGAGKNQAESDAVREIALGHLQRMMRLRAKVIRGGKPGAIHDFRVATRRFQQTFDLLLPADAPPALSDLRSKVARARRALSAVRDSDVSIALASAHFAASRRASRELWKSVAEFLSQRRRKQYRTAVSKLQRLGLHRAFIRLRSVVEPPSKGPHRFSRRLPEELRRLTSAYISATHTAAKNSSTPSIHKLRVAVKRLRYLVEIAERFDGVQSQEALRILRAFQEALGDWHDREIEMRLLTKLAKRPERLRGKLSKRDGIDKVLEQRRAGIARIKSRRPWGLDRAQRRRLEAGLVALAQRLAASSRV